MAINKKTLFIIKVCFMLLSLVGIVACQSSLFSYRGATVEPDDRINLLEEGPGHGVWQTFDLAIEYQYEKKTDMLELSGVVELSHHYRSLYDILTRFYLTVYFLDNEGKVLEGKQVLISNSLKLDDKFSFKHFLEIPPDTVSFTFSYLGGVRGGGGGRDPDGGSDGGSDSFYKFPRRSSS
jgi:hypothetical protein